jgi:hypothetical protein
MFPGIILIFTSEFLSLHIPLHRFLDSFAAVPNTQLKTIELLPSAGLVLYVAAFDHVFKHPFEELSVSPADLSAFHLPLKIVA